MLGYAFWWTHPLFHTQLASSCKFFRSAALVFFLIQIYCSFIQATYVTTETCVLLWDIRHGSRLQSLMAHDLKHSPKLLTSINLSADEEWLFFESETPHSASVCAFKWSEEPRFACSTTNYVTTASPLMLPAIRKTLSDSIGYLKQTESWVTWYRFWIHRVLPKNK